MIKYKVCILAAGVGSRMGPLSQYVNKAILWTKHRTKYLDVCHGTSTDSLPKILKNVNYDLLISYLSSLNIFL